MRQWVIDTNVLVSGLLSPHGPCARILDAVLEGRVQLACDARILREYRDVLLRPRLRLQPAQVRAFLQALQACRMAVTPERMATAAPDADDVMFIEAARATADRTIVTGNLARYPPEILHGARVLTPAQAVAELNRQ